MRTWSANAGRFEKKWADPVYQHIHAREWTLLRPLVQASRHVLDVGCGHGRLLAEIGTKGVGLEFAPKMLRRARQLLPHAKLVQGDAEYLPFKAASMDGVIFSESLPYTPQPRRAIAEAWRVLRPGGRVAISHLNPRGMFTHAISETLRARRSGQAERDWFLTPRKVKRLLRAAGFTDIRHAPITHIPWVRIPLWRSFPALEFLGPFREAGLNVFKRLDAKARHAGFTRYVLTTGVKQ